LLFVIAIADLEFGFFNFREGTWALPSVYGGLLNAVVFYGNAYGLKPRYRNNPTRYRRNTALFVLAVTALETGVDWVVARYYYASIYDIIAIGPVAAPEWVVWAGFTGEVFLLANLPVHAMFLAFSVAYRASLDERQSKQEKQALEQQKLLAELNYLKAQMNPHFLFNGINNAYHLIDEDPEAAKQFLLQFAALLRYQLYECQADRIPLAQELAYLDNYIALQSRRKGEDATIDCTLEAGPENVLIAPLLFTPFVENAFKYLSSYPDPAQNRLTIHLSVSGRTVDFQIKNARQSRPPGDDQAGGLGIANVQKRLHLLYPGKHQLRITEEVHWYQVHLRIELT
ncbi:MAG TPA: histidine kinase, partial [Cytophagales bacterium]|jgi:hypothetical protein